MGTVPESNSHTRHLLSPFQAKAGTWAAKHALDGPIVHHQPSLSAAVSRYAFARASYVKSVLRRAGESHFAQSDEASVLG